MANFYSAGDIKITWTTPSGSYDLSYGWAEDTFCTITRNSALQEFSPSAGGGGVFSKLADKSATVTLTFKDVSPVNKELAKAAAGQTLIGAALPIGVLTIEDVVGGSTHWFSTGAVLTEAPEITFGRASSERSWVFVCEYLIDTDDVNTLAGALSNYLPAQATNL